VQALWIEARRGRPELTARVEIHRIDWRRVVESLRHLNSLKEKCDRQIDESHRRRRNTCVAFNVEVFCSDRDNRAPHSTWPTHRSALERKSSQNAKRRRAGSLLFANHHKIIRP
jgi:hypothetical protein